MRPARLLLTLALILSACAGPKVETAHVPPVVVPDRWRTPIAATSPTDTAWWKMFDDSGLSALVSRALDKNLDIAIAGARIRDARAQELAARSALLPTLGLGGGALRSRSVSPFGKPEEQSAAEPIAQAAWEVDLFGRLADQRSAARSTWLASVAARDAIRLAVATTVANGYITLLAFDGRLAVARKTVEARSEALALIRRRARAGYSPRLDEAQAQAEYQAALQIIVPLELAIARQENALKPLTGDLPGPIPRATSLAVISDPGVPLALPSDLLRRRPDVAQSELQLAAADGSLAAARKRFLPQLDLSAEGGVALSTLLANPITIWSVGGSVLAPIFEGGRLRAGAERAGAQRDAAAFAYRKTALNAFREVDDALTGIVQADAQEKVLAVQCDALEQAFHLASNRYRAGYSPYLEQLDAERSLLGAQLGLVQARADTLTARITLYGALGGGWSANDVEAMR